MAGTAPESGARGARCATTGSVLRFRNGRIVENRVSANNFELELLMAPVLVPMVMPWLAGR